MENRPKVGIGVMVFKDNKVLLGKRKNAHGEGAWSFGGGHLEFGETWEDCAKREAKEETGIEITNVRFASATNDVFGKEGKHYVTIFMRAEHGTGEPKVMEPEFCEEWRWFEWDKLPKPLFAPIENLLKAGYRPF